MRTAKARRSGDNRGHGHHSCSAAAGALSRRTVLGLRRDALAELLDAVLTAAHPGSLVRSSLVSAFRRGWASVSDALADGALDVAARRRLFVTALPTPPVDRRPFWVIDGLTWPRPEAKTSPERTWGRFVTAGTPQRGIIGA